MVPVNLRDMDKAYQLGNQFGLAPLVLPIGVDNTDRTFVRDPPAYAGAQRQSAAFAGVWPIGGRWFVGEALAGHHVGVVLQENDRHHDQRPWPPGEDEVLRRYRRRGPVLGAQSGTVGLGVSILSYGGGVQFGVVSDSACRTPKTSLTDLNPNSQSSRW